MPAPVDLSKLNNVKNDVVRNFVYDKLAAKVNNIDTSEFLLKTKYQTDKAELGKKFLMLLILLKKKNSLRIKFQILLA